MKTTIHNIKNYLLPSPFGEGSGVRLPFGVVLLLLVLCCFSCSKDDNVSDMNLSGDCLVEELVLNGQYKATISTEKRLLKVKVPESFNQKGDMQITSLKLSAGATSNYKEGDHINLNADRPLHITNGDRFFDYQLSVRNDEAIMTSFLLEGVKGAIDQAAKTVKVSVTANSGIDLANATFTVECSEDAVCSPASGTKANFTSPVEITLTDNTASNTYTVTVELIAKPKALFLGDKATIEELNDEEKAAAKWMLGNIAGSAYASWSDIASGNMNTDEVKFIFWHHHCPSYGSYNQFVEAEANAMLAVVKLKELWANGVGFVLSRSAVNYSIALGAQPEDAYPNNVWGGNGEGGDKMGDDPWAFSVFDTTHPLWQNLKKFPGAGEDRVYTLDKDYTICNTTSQFHFDGAYAAGKSAVEEKTGGRALIGNSNEVAGWELKAANGQFGKGGIICIGSGLFDWNSPTDYVSNYHDNMGTIMTNAYNYVGKE
jgi:hypothetical protein